jgi:RNA polymerase sigma factor (TIGR02999 family)
VISAPPFGSRRPGQLVYNCYLPMHCAPSREITHLLKAWGAGDQTALGWLAPAIDRELRRLARVYLKREPADQKLQTTALINEAYLRLIEIRDLPWQDRTHFSAISAQIMRRVLVDAARSRRSEKRGGLLPHVPLDELLAAEALSASSRNDLQILPLNDALDTLAKIGSSQGKCN